MPLGEIAPGGRIEFIVQVGQVSSVKNELITIQRWFDPSLFQKAQDEISLYWQKYLSRLQVETPDIALNSMLKYTQSPSMPNDQDLVALSLPLSIGVWITGDGFP